MIEDRRPALSKAAEAFFKKLWTKPAPHQLAVAALVGRAAAVTEEHNHETKPDPARTIAIMQRQCLCAPKRRYGDVDEARLHAAVAGVTWSWIIVEASRVVCEHWTEIERLADPRKLIEAYHYVVSWSDEDATYIARVTEFPSLAAHGPTSAEAIIELQTLVASIIEDLRESDEPVPEPNP